MVDRAGENQENSRNGLRTLIFLQIIACPFVAAY
jgi:hypothetical protein